MGHRFQLIPQLLRFGTTKVELKFTKYFLTKPKTMHITVTCIAMLFFSFPIYIYILLPPFIIFFKSSLD
jgi:hypothetical protein